MNTEDLTSLLISLLLGSILGFEREYKSKAAGLRTIALICVGATLFTLMSKHISFYQNADRMASNIVTGIGFLGAGVIYKEGFNVAGLTTAATIWMGAAIGVTVGGGEYTLGVISLVISLVILSILEYVQAWIGRIHQKRTYRITFQSMHFTLKDLELFFKENCLEFRKRKEARNVTSITCIYDVFGKEAVLDKVNEKLINLDAIESFDF
ncbi:MAG: MgtC/SapB family protein [Filimonas sp.]|nr:MgtC/SapB family protein [Filimonas sp.]